jgi:hypothetical protein
MRALPLVLLIAVSLPSAAAAEPACKPVVGHFEASLVLPPACTSPVGLCTAGRVWGGLQGTYAFTMTTIQPSGAVPSISFFTGDSEVTLKNGDVVQGTDTGSIDLGPDGGFASLITFSGGTTGQIRLRGQLNLAEGTTSGDYIGTICTP